MPRAEVDNNRSVCCSSGLHIANWNYAQDYSGDVLVMVKTNPCHVVSVPSSYSNQKMRVCQYEVLGIIDKEMSAKYLEV
jgi:hypothetical protein